MAMIELEDSEDIHIENCRTDAEKLLKGKGLKTVMISDSEQLSKREEKAPSFMMKLGAWGLTIISAVIASAIAAYFGLG